ncbi:hypothetical protein B566_EDAN003845 [Ephemera danica]|nr:hypothetical protein B566_EDAN003845 [Ephemera danica]
MSTYDLLEHFEDVNDPVKVKDHKPYDGNSDDHLNKLIFKDKKLNKLWLKAERSGFTVAAELKTLHEEFTHHQDKIDQYQSLIGDGDKDRAKKKEQHKEIRDGYDRLHRLAAQGPANKEFVEPKVQGLWRIATQANFSAHELESLRVELMHYENRLLKLRHLQAEAQMNSDKDKKSEGKPSEAELLHMDKIKKQARKAEKLHYDLEARIMQKHVEL